MLEIVSFSMGLLKLKTFLPMNPRHKIRDRLAHLFNFFESENVTAETSFEMDSKSILQQFRVGGTLEITNETTKKWGFNDEKTQIWNH